MLKAETLVGREFLPRVLFEIGKAKKSIHIIIFDWRIYTRDKGRTTTDLIDAIQVAKLRGVEIKVICNNDFVKDQLTLLGIKCKRTIAYRMVHAKMILIDEKTLILGSHNFTQNAFERNLEISVLLNDTEDIPKLLTFFNNLWG